jgi:succinate dehydrogenase / fumarate reductase flavoprotein subunit
MAYEAGADLVDMGFVQFHPTGMVWPPSVRGTLITEGVRGEGGVLRNSQKERFMFRYVPAMNKGEYAESDEETREWLRQTLRKAQGEDIKITAKRPPELLTRDVVAKAINKEVAEGRGSPHGGVFLDIATQRTPAEITAKLPSMYHQFKELAEVDITKEPMEVGPTCHYAMGGVRVDADTGAATVPGLFAAGEAAGGMHGANRLGGNSLSDLLVFGKRAGDGAAAFAHATKELPPLDDGQVESLRQQMVAPLERTGGENPFAVHEALQTVMERHVGIIRNKADLEKGIAELDKLRERVENAGAPGGPHFNPGWHMALDLQAMLLASEASARAALAREESRGAHTRDDFPETRKELATFNLVVARKDGKMDVRREPIPAMPDDLKAALEGK